ncbi:MAG TPA: class I SAM-dependent methyltransferase [Acidimicrobiales bacterium]|nr:class I SAM-dependent methyltransferase [Acidimicrobiales bacterium]
MASGDDRPATAGFTDGARYDAARPDYPADALHWIVDGLGLTPSSRVLDLAAGTGIMTRQLLERVGSVVAVEPSAGMREVLAASLPDVEALVGTAEAIPLGDASVDAVVVAQAFHWFEPTAALIEIHRVLVSGGGLALIWNERDESVEWVDALSRAMRWDVERPYAAADFAPVIASGPFHDVEQARFAHHQTLSRAGLYQRVETTSYLAMMSDEERRPVMEAVARVVESLDEPITLPYVTETYRARAD